MLHYVQYDKRGGRCVNAGYRVPVTEYGAGFARE